MVTLAHKTQLDGQHRNKRMIVRHNRTSLILCVCLCFVIAISSGKQEKRSHTVAHLIPHDSIPFSSFSLFTRILCLLSADDSDVSFLLLFLVVVGVCFLV